MLITRDTHVYVYDLNFWGDNIKYHTEITQILLQASKEIGLEQIQIKLG